MTRKSINTTVDSDLYSSIQVLSYKLSAERKTKVNANDLLEEGMKLVLEKYKDK